MRNDQQCIHILCRRPCSWEQYIQWRWPFSNLQPTFGYTYIFVNQFQSLEISIKFWTAKMSLCSQACEHADTSNFLEMPFTYVLQKKIFFKLHNVCKFAYRHLYTSPSSYIKQSGKSDLPSLLFFQYGSWTFITFIELRILYIIINKHRANSHHAMSLQSHDLQQNLLVLSSCVSFPINLSSHHKMFFFFLFS